MWAAEIIFPERDKISIGGTRWISQAKRIITQGNVNKNTKAGGTKLIGAIEKDGKSW